MINEQYTTEQAIKVCLGLIATCRPRNGRQSAENQTCDKIVELVDRYFNVTANVNDLYATDPTFKQFLDNL